MSKIVVFLRKKRTGANSIEEIFHSLISYLGDNVELQELPCAGAGLKSIIKNIIFARKHRGDINHITGDVHYIALGTGRKTLVTIHDVQSIITGGALKRKIKKWLWFDLPLLIADKISVISKFTEKELLNICPFVKNKLSVVYNPMSKHLMCSHSACDKTMCNKKIVLHIGTKTNKNLEAVLRALEGLQVKLVVIGKMTEDQHSLAKALNIDYVNQYDLPYNEVLNHYAQADLVTFPSFYEGFGMPIIEANAIGVPIIVSNIDVLHEVARDAAFYINPYSDESIRCGIIELLRNEQLRIHLIAQGKTNAIRFAPLNIANQYKSLYNQL